MLCLALLPGACGADEPMPPEVPACRAGAPVGLEQVSADRVVVGLELPPGLQRERVAADLVAVLGALWSVPVEITTGANAPEPAAGVGIWISSSPAARAAASPAPQGFALVREATPSGARVVVAAADDATLVAGTYALLEELGARFFHPLQQLVPSYGAVHLPPVLEVRRQPAFAVRGVQLHTLHPIEWFRPFNEPGAENLERAKAFIDWLLRTGQNHVQWYLLRGMDLEAWRPHGKAILDYAHARGVTVAVLTQLWRGASLQDSLYLVSSSDDWQAQMESGIDELMTLPWDGIELSMGEFLAGDPDSVVEWLNHATAYVHDHYPGVELSVKNHIGNEEALWVDYQGKKTFYYHLPGQADPRLVNNIHTVMWFDLYREGGAYGHPNFHLHREFLLEQIDTRLMGYSPESAYWVTADIDVPAFLPEYINARYIDINGLHRDTTLAGKKAVHSHVMFSTGHEWGYWLTDYLAAKMMWEPEAPRARFFEHYAAAFGNCRSEASQLLTEFTDLQTKYLFDQALMPYVSGEDNADDAGYLIGVVTHAPRVAFHDVVAWSDAEQRAFEASVVDALDAAAAETLPLEQRARRLCQRADGALAPWCSELADGVAIVRLRLSHSARLYRAVLASARGTSASTQLGAAKSLRAQALSVVRRREQAYRFPLTELVDPWKNPTIYKFGYLRQAHTLCLWERQAAQAQYVIDDGVAPGFGDVPSCLD